MFNDSSWLRELPFLTVKLLRKLTGILEVPGILRGRQRNCFATTYLKDVKVNLNVP
jgi:hypothetical protein